MHQLLEKLNSQTVSLFGYTPRHMVMKMLKESWQLGDESKIITLSHGTGSIEGFFSLAMESEKSEALGIMIL